MKGRTDIDAVVIGSGPNGLAAAIRLAQAGLKVRVFELGKLGGGTRTEELTLPGFLHDVCSAIHPLAAASPFLSTLPLGDHGLELINPDAPLAHPLPDGSAVMLERSVEATAEGLGSDASAYCRLMGPLAREWPRFSADILAPLHLPRHPLAFALFGLAAVLPASLLARLAFRTEGARALFCGMAAHSFLPLDRLLSAAFGLMLGTLGHTGGWPIAKGGSKAVTAAMASYLRSLGGEVLLDAPIDSLDDLPPARIAMLDVTPRQLLHLAAGRLPERYRRRLEAYRYGPGVFKVDWALSEPIPWRAEECRRAATVHVGGTAEEMALGESQIWRGIHPERPFVLVAQPTLFDPSRAPQGKHTGWAYCHVPNGSAFDMTERIEAQMERFAPGFRDLILARHTRDCAEYERYNPNLVGGDINGGVQDIRQFLARPKLFSPYRTPLKGVYLCSSSTPPGGGVHGMCGFHAATAALRDLHKT